MTPRTPAAAGTRIDVWLDVACLFRTRSEAQRAITGGKVEVNGQSTRPHRLIHEGDQLRITRPAGRRQLILIKALAEKHLPKPEARLLYQGSHTAANTGGGGGKRAGAVLSSLPASRGAAPPRSARAASAPERKRRGRGEVDGMRD